MIDLFASAEIDEQAGPRRPTYQVLQGIEGTCRDCRLGQSTDRNNTGIVYGGPVTAEIAILGDALDFEGAAGVRTPIAGAAYLSLAEWIEHLDYLSKACKGKSRRLIEQECFVINAVQCKTQKAKKDLFRVPNRDEVDICFPRRALPVLQSLPNLRLVLTLGMTAAAAVLGWNPQPTTKSHEGCWFGSDYLPDAAIFCLNHPREYNRETEAAKMGRLEQQLQFLHNEYFQGDRPKILDVLTFRKRQRDQILADQ